MQEAAVILKEYSDFTSFSKRNTQVRSFVCDIKESRWLVQDQCLIYNVKANRFLRGMVRALTATMLNLGRGKTDLTAFRNIIEAKDCTLANFSAPAHGLFLTEVCFPGNYFI
jgi:tRNA pseudouridine38-40 synthase